MKWVVTVNLGLATAALALERSELLFLVFALAVAVIGIGLMTHYNTRMTKTREHAGVLELELGDPRASEADKTATYDCQELVAFILILVFSVVPTGLVFFARAFTCSVAA